MKFFNAIGFLTIIKISSRYYIKREDYPKTLVYFPVVGLILGLMASILFFSLNFVFPLFLTVIFIVCLEVILTGGIHIDGLADTFDGIFSGESDKIKIRQIMKKGDVGVFGVLAVIFSVAIKTALLYFTAKVLYTGQFLAFDQLSKSLYPAFEQNIFGLLVFVFILMFMPVYGRLSMLCLFSQSFSQSFSQDRKAINNKTAKDNTLSSAFIDRNNREVFILSSVYLSIIFIAAGIFSHLEFLNQSYSLISEGLYGQNFSMLLSTMLIEKFGIGIEIITAVIAVKLAIVVICTFLFAASAGRFFTKRVGRVSGDVFGAVCVLTEVFFLLLNYIVIKFV